MFHRWNLVTEDGSGYNGVGFEDDWQETDDQYEYEYYDWDDAKVKFLRRFDVLNVGTIHIMSFDDEGQPESEYIVDGVDLSHDHLGQWYDHDGFHWGSQQDLLGKAKWSEVRGGMGQWVMSNTGIFKIARGYLKNEANPDNPRVTSEDVPAQ